MHDSKLPVAEGKNHWVGSAKTTELAGFPAAGVASAPDSTGSTRPALDTDMASVEMDEQ